MAAVQLWEGGVIDHFMLEDQQIEALMKMGFVRGADLWSEDDRAPWSAQEIYNHFATEGNSNRYGPDC